MKAARYEGKRKITIVDIPKPTPHKDSRRTLNIKSIFFLFFKLTSEDNNK